MPDEVAAVLGWAVPALIAVAVAAIALAVVIWLARRAARSPLARAAAEKTRSAAGSILVRLDDAVDDLEIDLSLSGVLSGADAPASLRRARISAQHARDESFEEFRAISDPTATPAEVRRGAQRVERRCATALAATARARAEHAAWMRAHVSTAQQTDAARRRLAALRGAMGDPAALVAQLSARFADDEWQEAARAAHAAAVEADAAEHLLARAAGFADGHSGDALAELTRAERAIRQAETDTRILEESHRLVLQAALAVPDELAAAHAAHAQAAALLGRLEPRAAERLAAELHVGDATLTTAAADAVRRPLATIDALARLRERLDLAVGDTRTAQQRLRGARTALPGTLAAARHAVAQADATIAHARAGADARSRLDSAQRELAASRQAPDPVTALDAARRALRDAGEAKALGDAAGTTAG